MAAINPRRLSLHLGGLRCANPPYVLEQFVATSASRTDPSEPRYQKNIDRVVEMKFKGDRLRRGQRKAYEKIAGGRKKLKIISEGKECKCSEGNGRKQILEQFAAMPVSEDNAEQSIDWGAVTETAGMAVATAVGVVATAALMLSPFEGPAGDIAAGSATAVAAARTASAFRRIFRPLPH